MMTFAREGNFFFTSSLKTQQKKRLFLHKFQSDAEAKKRRRRRLENDDDEEGFIKVLVVQQKLNLGVESEETKRPRRDRKNS